MKIKYYLLIALSILLSLLAPSLSVAENPEQAYRKAREAYYALQNSARKQMFREQWERVYRQFDHVYDRYPQSKRGADALFMCAKTTAGLYQVSRVKPDALRAVELYEDMAAIYPESTLADDALLEAGKLLEGVLNDKQRAYLVYYRLVSSLPRGDMHAKAKKRLATLEDFAPPEEKAPDQKRIVAKPKGTKPDQKTAKRGPSSERRLSLIRYWSNPGYTRIVLDVSSESAFSANYLAPDPGRKIPPRLYVDIEETGLDPQLQETTIVDDGLLKRIRTGAPNKGTIRVVLDLESIGDYKVFPLSDPWRIVIDIAGEKSPSIKRDETAIRALPDSGHDAIGSILKGSSGGQPPVQIRKSQGGTTLRRIVVDAGHGGKDPGAIGPSGVYEKDITLKLAKELAKELTKLIGCEVILTRSADVYLPLEERTAIANKVGADLFISLHANATKNRKAYGIETYYLNFSKNDKAAAVAARENGTSLKQVSDLELILFDLMANAKINESSRLAAEIQKSLVQRIGQKYSNVRDLGVRQGPFYVLLGATMPSVLVETAFISHPREEKRLVSSAYRKSAAKAIALAVKKYALDNNLIAAR